MPPDFKTSQIAVKYLLIAFIVVLLLLTSCGEWYVAKYGRALRKEAPALLVSGIPDLNVTLLYSGYHDYYNSYSAYCKLNLKTNLTGTFEVPEEFRNYGARVTAEIWDSDGTANKGEFKSESLTLSGDTEFVDDTAIVIMKDGTSAPYDSSSINECGVTTIFSYSTIYTTQTYNTSTTTTL